ncbi:predicted protein [Chaetoceros tenuissimus]|uniref:Uncharacterized protein n=1 Tax=Chaetoceros tenuissimus TaxID=426638 RepID=A0AAD3D123_9STRA|nr:predicted protein [Chaetoceros tenuissimus]
MSSTLNDIEMAEKLATLVHCFDELPKYFLLLESWCSKHIKTLIMFWEWAEDIFLQDGLELKNHMIWNRMQKDANDRNRAHGLWNDIVEYTGDQNELLQNAFYLPLHSAIRSEVAMSFVPVLVEEGMNYDIPLVANANNVVLCKDWLEKRGIQDRHDSRGGLLSFRNYIKYSSWPCDIQQNSLQMLAYWGRCYCSDEDNEKVVEIFDQLKDRNMIKKQDIFDHQLMEIAAERTTLHLLKWIVDWEPNSLLMICKPPSLLAMICMESMKDVPLMHFCLQQPLSNPVRSKFIPRNYFVDILDLAFCYFPKQLGLLFLESKKKYLTTPFLILHRAIEEQEEGRWKSPEEAAIPSKTRVKVKFWSIIEEALSKVNPLKYLALDKETFMFPFMLAAKGETADLNLVYYLMRKDPQVWSVV